VRLHLQVSRWRCGNDGCPRKILPSAHRSWLCLGHAEPTVCASCATDWSRDGRAAGGHGRELAADSIPSKKESAIEHGDENAIEAPPDYDEFSVNGNEPLKSVSQSRGALQTATPPGAA
jgi:hypothetical protein